MKTIRRIAKEREHPMGLEVVVAYDGLSSGKQAKELCDRLAQQLGSGWKLRLSFWSLPVLQIPQMLRAAARKAALADLVVIASNGQKDLPAWAKTWVRSFSRERSRTEGVLALLLQNTSMLRKELAPTWAYLKGAAHAAGLAFFTKVVEPKDDFPRLLRPTTDAPVKAPQWWTLFSSGPSPHSGKAV